MPMPIKSHEVWLCMKAELDRLQFKQTLAPLQFVETIVRTKKATQNVSLENLRIIGKSYKTVRKVDSPENSSTDVQYYVQLTSERTYPQFTGFAVCIALI